MASIEAIRSELQTRDVTILEAIAGNDANQQLEQINNFIARGVDGIIVAPRDAQTVMAMIKAANRADVPIVLYNRPPAPEVVCPTDMDLPLLVGSVPLCLPKIVN